MIRKTIAWAGFVAALLLLALPVYFLQERMEPGPPVGVEIVNEGQDPIWLQGETADGVLLQLEAGESDMTCLLQVTELHVHQTDPRGDAQSGPEFTLPWGGRDFCDGTYRWDGSTLSQVR